MHVPRFLDLLYGYGKELHPDDDSNNLHPTSLVVVLPVYVLTGHGHEQLCSGHGLYILSVLPSYFHLHQDFRL